MTSLPAPNRDPGFDINTATNTFYKALADRLKSGQMTLDQARAAQAEMRALQLNPAAANRQAATDIAQRHLQVGQYSPANVAAQQAAQQPQGGLTLAKTAQGVGGTGQSVNPITPPQEIMVTPQRMPEIAAPPPTRTYYDPEGPVMPPVSQPQELPVTPTQPDMPERHSEYGIPLWMQLGAGPERDVAYAQYMKAQRGEMQPKGIGGMPQQHGLVDNRIGPNFGKPMQPEGPRGLMGIGLGRALGMPMQGVGMAPQMPQGMTLSNVPRQLTLSNVPMQGAAPQPVSAPQGMAMGGLLRKYYGGGMC